MKGVAILLSIYISTFFSMCSKQYPAQVIVKNYRDIIDSSKKSSVTHVDSLLYFGKNYFAEIEYYEDLKIRGIKSFLLARKYGHHFLFDKYGALENYHYLRGNGVSNYFIKYENDSSRYIESGTPLVDWWRDESVNEGNKLGFRILFSKFPRKKVSVKFSFTGIDYMPLQLAESSLVPFVDEALFLLPQDTEIVYFKIESTTLIYNWSSFEPSMFFLDTLRISN